MTDSQAKLTPSSPAPSTRAGLRGAWPWRVATLGMTLELLGLIALAVSVAWTLVNGSASTTVRAGTETVVIVLLAVGVGLLALNLARGKALAKTPTLLWNGMLIPVGFNLIGGGARVIGWVTIALAAVTFGATLFIPRFDFEDDETTQD